MSSADMTQAEILDRLKTLRREVEARMGRRLTKAQFMAGIDVEDVTRRLSDRKDSLGRPPVRDFCVNIDGWTARQGKDGYYRMYKTIDGESRSIYLGKRLDWDKARRKIAAKERRSGDLL